MGRHPSNAKEFYAFGLSIVGDVTKGLEQNKYVVAPSSEVELFEETDNPMAYLGKGDRTIGYYNDTRSWRGVLSGPSDLRTTFPNDHDHDSHAAD